MAKRLNKKVALIGSAVFLLVALVAVVAILYLSRDPQKFLQDGDAAWLAKDYEAAKRSYQKAYQSAKSDTLRIEILFKLEDLYIETDEWPKVRGCWEQIINIDPTNLTARLGRLKHLYIIADNYAKAGRSVSQVWTEIESQASDLIEVATDRGVLEQDKAQWEPSLGADQDRHDRAESQSMGAYLYLVRGRAAYELAKMGAVTVPDQLLAKARDDLQKVQQFDPNNIDAYCYLADVTVEEGEILASKGNVQERDKAQKQADELLQRAIEVAADDPRAHINLLSRKLNRAWTSRTAEAQEQMAALEPAYQSLVKQFPSQPEAWAALSRFYSVYAIDSGHERGLERLDGAVEAMEKAIGLDSENVEYAMGAANLHYRRFSVYGQKSEVFKAIELAEKALALPDAQDTTGPRSYANRMNRFLLHSFLGNCYVEQVLEPCDDAARAQAAVWLAKAEKVVHEIEQLSGSGEEPQVVKWQGMLELARGNVNVAARHLYEAYQRIKTSRTLRRGDAHLCYTLAKIFQDTSEVGAVTEFLAGARAAGIEWTKPTAILDYLDVLALGRGWSDVINGVDSFEQKYGPSPRSQTLQINALIGMGQFAEAEEKLAKLSADDPSTVELNIALIEAKINQLRSAIVQKRMREGSGTIFGQGEIEQQTDLESDASTKGMKAELDSYKLQRADLVQQLLLTAPASVEEATVAKVCRDLIAMGRTDKVEQLTSRFLSHFPDSTAVLFYKRILSEPDPANVSEQRLAAIEEQILSKIADPVRRAVELGTFYRRHDELDRAVGQFQKVLQTPDSGQGSVGGPAFKLSEKSSPRRLAASHLFDIATDRKDWILAEDIVQTVRRENLDDCEGQLFAGRLAVAKGEFEDALTRINDCLRQKPIFSRAYMLRSNIHAVLGNDHAALDDIQKAASLNPLDGTIAKGLANALYRRNMKLGDDVSSDQSLETQRALQNAMVLNPGDLTVLSAYAAYISSKDPLKALAIRQTLQQNAPTLENALLLAKLATRMALDESDKDRKETLFQLAGSSLEQARQMKPHDRSVLETYADYYRALGLNDKAEELLSQANDQGLLWRHHFHLGQFEEAQKVLQQMYESQPKDSDAVRGLFLVSERTADSESIKRYSEELLSLEDNAQNRLDQIKAYLKIGLVKEAEYKLQSFKEKYPDESGVLLLEGWLAMRQGQLPKALDLTNRNLETSQDNAAAWRLRGEINILLQDYDRAIIDLKRSKSLAVTPDTRMALARAYLRTRREDDAVTELKHTIDVPGAPVEARAMLERTLLRLGRKEALRKLYEDTLAKYPRSVFWLNRAAGFAIVLRDSRTAEQLYRRAFLLKRQAYLSQEPEASAGDVQYAIALDGYLQSLLMGAGRPDATTGGWQPQKLDKVFEVSEEYKNTSFAPVALYRIAEGKLRLGDKPAAIQYCREAVDRAGTNERLASEILLRMFLLLGDEEVSKYCQQRLQTDPDSLAANFTMFNLAKIRNEYDEAIGYIDQCIQLAGLDSPRGVDYTVKKARLLTLAYLKTSDNTYLKKAIRDYESLLAKKPKNTMVLNNLAYMLAESNERLSEALEYARQALELTPNSASFLDTYAYVLCKNGQNAKADEFMTAALQLYEQSERTAPPEVYEHLGMIKERLGQKSRAINAYERALEVGADNLPDAVKRRLTSAIERLSS